MIRPEFHHVGTVYLRISQLRRLTLWGIVDSPYGVRAKVLRALVLARYPRPYLTV